jgi:hypothetical protein
MTVGIGNGRLCVCVVLRNYCALVLCGSSVRCDDEEEERVVESGSWRLMKGWAGERRQTFVLVSEC